jgi:hypothetical protein
LLVNCLTIAAYLQAAKDKKGRKHKIGEWTAHGPFVPNGILERNQNSAKAWDTLSKRVTAYKKVKAGRLR